LLTRLAAIAALLAVPLAAVSPVAAAPMPMPSASAAPDAEESPEPAEGQGLSIGYGLSADPRTWQFGSAVMIRTHPGGDWSEAILGLTSRNQVIEPNGLYAIESTGLNAALGLQLWFLRLGVAAELDWVKRITQNAGKLQFENKPGFLVEPYIGTALPFLNTPFTQLDARVYVPVTTFAPALTYLSPDPAYGPRVALNLWIGFPAGLGDEEDSEETPEEPETPEGGDEEDEMDEAPAPKAAPTPAPKPTARPTPKPAAKPTKRK
jgi:hypothetical protein